MAVTARALTEPHARPEALPNGGEIMCRALVEEGVRYLFGYPGGAIMPFYDSLYGCPELQHILVRHEQGATHAADGFARATGQVGVCIGTSGPGATNMVTGLATAYMDSVPIVAITGQVARPAIGKDSFQETDVLGVTMSVTKHNILVRNTDEIGCAIHEAFSIARSGRPGPVLIDVPKDVQFERAVYEPQVGEPARWPRHPELEELLSTAAQMIDNAKQPVIMAGHGVVLSRGYEALHHLAERTGMPVITTLLGISCFPEADVIFAVGMRFDDRVTGNVSEFAPNAQIIHVELEPAELEKVVPTAIAINGDAREVMDRLGEMVEPNEHHSWVSTIKMWDSPAPPVEEDLPHPAAILDGIKRASGGEAVLVTDVGQHQMWAARHYGYDRPNSHFTSGGLGTMGFALPASMGVKLGRPEDQVWVVAGDGGIQMNIQELATIADHNIDVKIVIMNNGYLGMVRQWQKFFHGGRYSSTPISSPNYLHLAAAYGLQARKVDRLEELDAALEWAANVEGAVIVDVAIEQERNVYPMIPSGQSVKQMIEEPAQKAEHA